MVLVPILLLNMLIAMMGNTYAHVIEQSEKEWMKQVRNIRTNIIHTKMFIDFYLKLEINFKIDEVHKQIIFPYS